MGGGNGSDAASGATDPADRRSPEARAASGVNPILFHYMMVSLTATLSGFGPEMRFTSGLSDKDPKVVEAYWRLVNETVFGTR
jgi:hypothetical protein